MAHAIWAPVVAEARPLAFVAVAHWGHGPAPGVDFAVFPLAGIEGSVAPTHQYDEDMFDRVMAVNVKGVFLGLRHVLPVMIRQARGAIVNTASVAGLVASPGMPAYVASKLAQ
jgi:NAD(P)-dependent dehydrogenase (short-subunit alcohol dehydrogenase family)